MAEQNNNTEQKYNPLGYNITSRGFEDIMAGSDPTKSVITFGSGAKPIINYQNIGSAKPATVAATNQGTLVGLEGMQELLADEEALRKDVEGIYNTLTPDFAKKYNQNSKLTQLLNAPAQAVDKASSSAGSQILNIAHSVAAQAHNLEEERWKNYIASYRDDDPDKMSALQAIQGYYANGYKNFQYANIDRLTDANGNPLSSGARDIVEHYQELTQARRDNQQNMQIENLYESYANEDNTVKRIVRKVAGEGGFGLGLWSDISEADRESTIGTVADLTGDVAGSIAISYATGMGARGLGAGVARGLRALAPKAVKLALGASSVTGYGSVFTNSFLAQYNRIRTQALLAGKDLDTANAAGMYAGAVEGALEFAGFKGFNRLMSRKGFIRNIILRDVLPESLQETSQTIGENIITESFGITDKQFTDILSEVGMSALGGALGGGFFAKGIRGGAVRAAGWMTRIKYDEALSLEGVPVQARQDGFKRAAAKMEQKLEAAIKDAKTVKDVNLEKEVEKAPESKSVEEQVQQKIKTEQPAQTVEQPVNKETSKEQITKEEQTVKETDVLKAEKAYMQSLDDMYRVYLEKAKTLAPNMTKEQLVNGWRAVTAMARLQYRGNLLSEQLDVLIDSALNHINKQDSAIKRNVSETVDILKMGGMSEEDAQKLASDNWSEKHEAQWKVAENNFYEQARLAGIREEEAKLTFRFLKGLMYDTTFINPGTSVADLMRAMDLHIVNTQILHLYGRDMDIPEPFLPAVSFIPKSKQISVDAKLQEAREGVELLNADKLNDAAVRTKIYGGPKRGVSAQQTKDNLQYLADTESRILNNAPFKVSRNYSQEELMTMALMREKGATQSEINQAFGIGVAEGVKESPEEIRQNALNKLYPMPSDKDITKLNRIGEEVNSSETISGVYSSDENLVVVADPRTGTAAHEIGHFGITKALVEGINLDKMGLLPNGNIMRRIYSATRNILVKDGVYPTDKQLQETLLDQLNKFLRDGKTDDPQLTKELNEFNAIKNANTDRIAGSLLPNRSDRTNLTQEQKENLSAATSDIVSNNTPAGKIAMADELLNSALFYKESKSGTISPEADLFGLKTKLDDFLETGLVENADQKKMAAEIAFKANDMLALSGIAFDVAVTTKNKLLSSLVDGAVKLTEEENKLAGQISENDLYFWTFQKKSEDGDKAVRVPARQERTFEQYYKEFSPKEMGKNVLSSLDSLLVSLDSAANAVSPELASRLSRAMYEFQEKTLAAKDKIGIITNAMEENRKKYQNTDSDKFFGWPEFSRAWAKLGNGTKDCYENMGKLLENKLGVEAKQSWDNLVAELKETKGELIKVGLDPKLFGIENFFPMAVSHYDELNKNYYKNPSKKIEIDKLVERSYKEATKDKDGKPKKLSMQESLKLRAKIIDDITSRYQRNVDDSSKVSSFYKRRVWQYNDEILKYYKDPFDTLGDYLESVYRTVMMRKLIGRIQYDANGDPIFNAGFAGDTAGKGTNYVGQFLLEYTSNNKLTDTQKDAVIRFERAMQSLAARDKGGLGSEFFNTIRQLNSLTMLGSPINALNQLSDLYLVATAFGGKNTFDAIVEVLRREGITVRDVNVQSSNEAYRPADEGAINKATKKVYKYTGFEKIDVGVKNVTLNAAAKWFKQALNNPKSADYKMAMHYINICFPDGSFLPGGWTEEAMAKESAERETTRSRLFDNLKNGNMEDSDVKYLLWYMLGKMQPQSALTVPANYNKMGPLGKLCYQFTTVSIRQLEFLTDYYKTLWNAGGKKEVALKLSKMLLFMLAIGVPKEALIDIMRGRKPNLGKIAAFTPLQPLMINEFMVSTLQKEGLWGAMTTIGRPSFGLATDVSKDVINVLTGKDFKGNTFKSVPVFGWMAYYWMFGGADYNAKMKQRLFSDNNTIDSAQQAIAYMRNF